MKKSQANRNDVYNYFHLLSNTTFKRKILHFRTIIISLRVLDSLSTMKRNEDRSFMYNERNKFSKWIFQRKISVSGCIYAFSKFIKARFRTQGRSMYLLPLDWVIKNFSFIYTTFSWMLHWNFQSWCVDFARDKLDYYYWRWRTLFDENYCQWYYGDRKMYRLQKGKSIFKTA